MSQVIATYDYPENDTYEGPAFKGVISFRGVKGTQIAIKYIMEELIVAKCYLADVVPLRAILKVSQIQLDYLDYVTDEYELILYYHESPSLISVMYAIAIALGALGFLILAWRASKTTWEKIAEVPMELIQLPEKISKSFINTASAALLSVLAYMLYKYTNT